MKVTVSGSMEPVKANKFVMFGAWWRVEVDVNRTVNNIPANFSSMGFGVEFRKLYILSYVHHVKCFPKVNIMESGDKDSKRPGLGYYTVCQDSFNCCLIFLI